MIILKIGGGKDINITGVAEDLAALSEPLLIVHGANAWRDELAGRMGWEINRVTSVSGFGSTLSDTGLIDLQMMAYAGLRNKRIVETLRQHGVNAIGLSGLDGALIRGKRNAGIRVRQKGKLKLLKDFSGKPRSINSALLDMLLEAGYVPVITVPIIDENNRAINSENDDIVTLLNSHYKARRVIQLIEEKGLLSDPADRDSLVEKVTRADLETWINKEQGRIKRKLYAIGKLLAGGADKVVIADGRLEHPVNAALRDKGTVFE